MFCVLDRRPSKELSGGETGYGNLAAPTESEFSHVQFL